MRKVLNDYVQMTMYVFLQKSKVIEIDNKRIELQLVSVRLNSHTFSKLIHVYVTSYNYKQECTHVINLVNFSGCVPIIIYMYNKIIHYHCRMPLAILDTIFAWP